MKTKLHATIPTTQYGNIRPVFELEDGDDEATALESLQNLWNRFGEKPLHDKNQGGVKVESFTHEELMWNESTHTYTDMAGNVLLSGSKYAEENSPKFDIETILPKTAQSWGVDEDSLRKIWKYNSEVSQHWGSALHLALEAYVNFRNVGEAIKENKELEENYVLSKHPYLRKAVKSFFETFSLSDNLVSEPIVSDVQNKMAGTVDLLEVLPDKTCRIGDYKTNAEMDSKKKKKYQLQLSFYAKIMQNKGWTVQGLDLYHYGEDTGWQKDELDILDVSV